MFGCSGGSKGREGAYLFSTFALFLMNKPCEVKHASEIPRNVSVVGIKTAIKQALIMIVGNIYLLIRFI